MKKHFYLGMVFTGLMATSGIAQAGENTPYFHASSSPQAVQPYNVAYKVDRQAIPKKRVVRVVKVEAPRARMVNGAYQMPSPVTSHRRKIVTQPTKAMPNLYASVAPSATPVFFDQAALSAR